MPVLHDLIPLIHSFEHYLGDPRQNTTPLNYQESLRLDERESLPAQQIVFVQQWGYMDYLIPQELGGKLQSLSSLYQLTKALARRDLTTAIALGLTFLAALPIWIAGNEKQQRTLANYIRNGHIGSLALTEEEHGTDLTANEMIATPQAEGWLLSGKKWCVNYATLGKTATILCRTHPSGGLLGFSLFFLEKEAVQSKMTFLAKLPTHGVRGLDISGFSLDEVWLPETSLIGAKNQGLDITYKTLQVSRTLCTNLSLGAADTALRLAISYSLQRQLYGQSIYAIPAVSQRLAECLCYLLIADSTGSAMIRACTIIPESMTLWSSIVKFIIPKIAEEIVEQCALVIGARAYLRTTEWAIFQKIRRDNQIVGLFDGSSQVNLFIIAGHLVPQAKLRAQTKQTNQQRLNQIFNFTKAIPAFTGKGLNCFNHTVDEVIAGILTLKSAKINSLISLIYDEIMQFDQRILYLHEHALLDNRGLEAFRLAEQYCWIFAASCTLLVWFYNQKHLSEELQNDDWLTLAIQLILNRINKNSVRIEPDLQYSVASILNQFYDEKKMFSMLPIHITG
ncbi:acyl-CoA dehydrogenase [Legionella nagasakiensis]|uniref:acyl-CoA dehydrogenase n=1 Tax=Legionella nagasakiensis TaxID=535290 RepID=UPI0010566027|nr:acyl-CoA dehydrogenase [Legionella nagasakiensis]